MGHNRDELALGFQELAAPLGLHADVMLKPNQLLVDAVRLARVSWICLVCSLTCRFSAATHVMNRMIPNPNAPVKARIRSRVSHGGRLNARYPPGREG